MSAPAWAGEPVATHIGEPAATAAGGPILTNAVAPGTPPRWRRVVGVGDSVLAGIGDPVDGYADVSWFDQVVALLGPATTAVNLGVVGLRAAEIRETQLGRALALRPDLVPLSAGGNDMFAKDFDPGTVAGHLDHMVGMLRRAGADVLLFGFYAIGHLLEVPPAVRERLATNNRSLARITAEVARRHGAIHVDNSHRLVAAELMSADGIHFNRRGHAHIARTVAEALGLEPR